MGGIPETLTEQDLLDYFYAYGEVRAIRKSAAKRCAFVTFATRLMAEDTATAHAGKGLQIKGSRLKLMWGRPRPAGQEQQSNKRPLAGGVAQPPPPVLQQSAHPYPSMVRPLLLLLLFTFALHLYLFANIHMLCGPPLFISLVLNH